MKNREVDYIVTNPSEDLSKSVRINYHAYTKGTYLEYTTEDDYNYINKKVVYPQEEKFSIISNNDGFVSEGFKDGLICKVELNDLKPNTKYMYRVGKSHFFENYYFKTANQGEFSFLYIADPQYADEKGAEVFNHLITVGIEKQDIAFTFFTGDIVDRGGFEEQWALFFSRSNIKKGIVATGVGNHEYYDASPIPQTFNSSYYNAFHNNPKNGAKNILNTSYFFLYNNTLFIMLNTENNLVENQQLWFEEVMKKHRDVDFVIVGMHRSFYGSIYASHSIIVRKNWQSLFDKYKIDLVLSGHDHIYARSHSIFNDQISKEEGKGTIYVIGGSGGKKFYDANNNIKYAKVIERVTVANLITIKEKQLSVEVFEENGKILDSYEIFK